MKQTVPYENLSKGLIKLKRKLKQTLSVILSVLIFSSCAGLVHAGAQAPLSVFVAADCHYSPLSMLGPIGEETGLPGDPLYWHTNIQGELTYESDAIMTELLARFKTSSSNFLLIPGDISDGGLRGQHQALAEKFKQFEEKTGKSIFIINGNHDVSSISDSKYIDLAEFKAIYAGFGYSEAVCEDASSASYTADLDKGYRLIAIDSSIYGEDAGQISADLLMWVENQVADAKADGVKLIGMMHHSLLEHFKIQGIVGDTVKDYRKLSAAFADWGIKVVFTGHKHSNDMTSAVSAKGNRIYDIETTSLVNYPNTYRCVSFSDSGIKVESTNIEKIDTSFLTAGYSQAQLELIRTDFPAYSFGYFNAGMHRWINEYIGTPRKVAGWLNIEQGTGAYDALKLAMTVFGEALNLPIYDTAGTPAIDSVEEIAKSAGETVMPSSYTRFSDLLAFLVTRMFSGDENTPYDSPEVKLFLQTFKAALVYALVNIPDDAAAELFKNFGLPGLNAGDVSYSQAAKLIFAKTAASKVIGAVIKPLIEGITIDSFSPGDLNETLEAYGVSGGTQDGDDPITGFQVIMDILERLFSVFMNALKTSFVF